jgi:hypothetical protein
MGPILHGTLVEVLLCIEAATGPVANCQLAGIYCRWCLVPEGVAMAAAAVTEAAATQSPIAAARILAGEGLRWSAVTQRASFSLARSAAACFVLSS